MAQEVTERPEIHRWASALLGGDYHHEEIRGNASERAYGRYYTPARSLVGYSAPDSLHGIEIARHASTSLRLIDAGVSTPKVLRWSSRSLLMEDAGRPTLSSLHPRGVPPAVAARVLALGLSVTFAALPPSVYDRRPSLVWDNARAAGLSPETLSTLLLVEDYVGRMPRAVQHGDLHARNVVVSDEGVFSLVDVQDAGLAPYALDAGLLAVDPNYAEFTLTVDEVATHLAGSARRWPSDGRRDFRLDAVAAMTFQCLWLVGVCHRLFEEGKGRSFRVESETAAAKLRVLLPMLPASHG